MLLVAFASPFATAGTSAGFSQQTRELRAASYRIPRTTLKRLRVLEAKSQPLTPAQQAQALDVAAGIQFWSRDPDGLMKTVSRMERLAADQHDSSLAVTALLNQAYVASKELHDAPLSRKLIDQAKAPAATTHDIAAQVNALRAVGLIDAEEGHPQAGLVHLDRAVKPARAADDVDELIIALKAQAVTSRRYVSAKLEFPLNPFGPFHTHQSAFTQHINMSDCADHKADQDCNIYEEDSTNLRVVASYCPGKIEERNNADDPPNNGNRLKCGLEGGKQQEAPDKPEKNRAMTHEDCKIRLVEGQAI